MSKVVRTIHIALDFDGTLTTHDTLDQLAQIGYNAFPDTQPSWNSISQAYMSDYSAHASSYHPAAENRSSIAEEVAWLRSLKHVEEASAARVEHAGFLRKLNATAVRQGAHIAVQDGDTAFRRGWTEMLLRAETSIISVNFSRYFVYQSLQRAAEKEQADETVREAIGNVPINANEMTGVDPQTARTVPGQAVELRTSAEKMELFNRQHASSQEGRKALKIYVGDSPTDLECLLAADIGICMRDDQMRSGQQELADTCARLAVQVKHLKEGLHAYTTYDGDVRREGDRKLWWANDFVEINESISQILTD